MNFIHKDSKPKETIIRIKKILSEVGISLTISDNIIISDSQFFSCRLTDKEIKAIGTNGKGLTEDLALASAYAEFMERLQNGILYPSYFGNKKRHFKYKDELLQDKAKYIENEKDVVKEFKLEGKIIKDELRTLPFYNFKHDKIKYLPIEQIARHTWSTGMCAGNTPEEAMCQGICEIFERKTSSELFVKPFEIPTIPLSFIKNKKILALINYFKEKNIKIIIKDITRGGVFPVIGIIAINEKKSKARLNIGADPIFETALSRCLSEIVQGFTVDDLEFKMENIDFCFEYDQSDTLIDSFSFTTVGASRVPPNIFIDYDFKEENIEKAFQQKFENHKKSLKFLVDIFKENNMNLYIRDNSILGFPSYWIVCPKIKGYIHNDLFSENNHNQGFSKLLKFNSLSEKELRELDDECEAFLNTKHSYPRLMSKHILKYSDSNIYVTEDSNLTYLNARIYLVMRYIKRGEYKLALERLKEELKIKQYYEESEYFSALQLYLYMKYRQINDVIIKNTLISIYSIDLYKEIIYDLKDENLFKNYKMPNCPDCENCDTYSECLYEDWLKKIKLINKKQKLLDQSKIRHILTWTNQNQRDLP